MKVEKSRVRKRVSVVAFLLLIACAAEALVRVAQRIVYGVPVATFLPMHRDTRFQESPFLVFGPRVDWVIPGKPIPDLARFNADGFRTIEPLDERIDGEIRIVAMGGSTTENVWNDDGSHWPLVAQCLLRREGYPVRIINAAMSAYSTAHSLLRLQFSVLDKAEPDIVLVMHLINDLTVTYEAAARGEEVDPTYLVKYGSKGYTAEVDPSDIVLSRAFRAIASRTWARDEEPTPPSEWVYDLGPGLDYFRRNLRLLSTVIRDRGADPVFLTMPRSSDSEHHRISVEEFRPGMPGIGKLPELNRFLDDFDRFNAEIRASAVRDGIHLVDLAVTVPDQRDFFVDPVHFTSAGVHEVGARVAEGLIPILPSPGAEPVTPGIECDLLASLQISSGEEENSSSAVPGSPIGSLVRRRSCGSHRVERWQSPSVFRAA